MLADVKPELSAVSEVSEAEINLLAQQFRERNKNQNLQTQPHPSIPATVCQTASDNQSRVDSSVGKFGWEEIEHICLPYIKRDTGNCVASILVSTYAFKNIDFYFSEHLINCVPYAKVAMTQYEANLFNEINIVHSDGKLAGDYKFTVGEEMMRLEDVKKTSKFFLACYKALFRQDKQNDLFGFIRIQGGNAVPFVWSESKKLVPLFYFEGQSEYLNERAIELTDIWKIAYFKFCCKVQNIKKDHYEKTSLMVVYLEDVIQLFPKGTTFEMYWPEEVNQELYNSNKGRNTASLEHLKQTELNSRIDTTIVSNTNQPICSTVDSIGVIQSCRQPGSSDTQSKEPQQEMVSKQQQTFKKKTPSMPVKTRYTPSLPKGPNKRKSCKASIVAQPQLPPSVDIVPVSSPQSYMTNTLQQRNQPQSLNSGFQIQEKTSVAAVTPISTPMTTELPNTNSVAITPGNPVQSHITNVPYRSPEPGIIPPGCGQQGPLLNRHQQMQMGQVSNFSHAPINGYRVEASQYQQTTITYNLPQNTTITSIDQSNEQPWIEDQNNLPSYQTQSMVQTVYQKVPQYSSDQHTLVSPEGQQMHLQNYRSVSNPNVIEINPMSNISSQQSPTSATSHFDGQYSASQYHQQIGYQTTNPTYPPASSGYCTMPYSCPPAQTQQCIQNPYPNAIQNGMGVTNYLPGPVTSGPIGRSNTPQDNNNNNNNNGLKRLKEIKHLTYVSSLPEVYYLRECTILSRKLMGISMYPYQSQFFINLGEFMAIIYPLRMDYFRKVRDTFNQTKHLYQLNPIQNQRWQQYARTKNFNPAIVENSEFMRYDDILSVIKSIH